MSRQPSSADFWNWFSTNRGLLEGVITQMYEGQGRPDDLDERMGRIHAALHAYDDRLAFEIGRLANGDFDFVVSAEGDTAAFDRVFELVTSAPRLAGWRFTPLKPRNPEAFVRAMLGENEFSAEDLRFYAQPDMDQPGRFTLLLLADVDEAFMHEHWDGLQTVGTLTADAQLGEHDSAYYLSQIGVVRLSAFRERWGHDGQPIAELQAEFPPLQVN